MSVNTRLIAATPDDVWNVLADGWLYPLWVVGATRMRDVDATWPDKGSRIHHSVGVWPLLIDDHTEVLEVVPGRSITLKARAWPIGEAKVDIRLSDVGAQTEVVITEDAIAGPGVLVPEPFKGLSLKWRNTETLRRLAFVVEGRHKARRSAPRRETEES
ncbi:SRPBCC family protein [Aeromicrobium ginsengisoli]|uniref:SRPBCC domain-containing protein n=1 Tax=Aeromicrobium ginsengisoli TaxID=363867 RepID=A0A5M4FDW4_9ACTN|nr:SRPBCC domain-containing protein [Aeromicrobium ginsengisoli]KAA1397408.1 SRPBCC domain-containing protein [Aeromicrobium ginsengisoli]